MGERGAGSAALFQEGRSRMTAKQLPDDTYLDKIYTMLAQIEQEEGAAMDAAARAAYASIDGGGLLHVFSTGHSHMIVEEMFYRSGGLVPVNPILSDELMLHTGAITSTHMERMPGKAAEVLGKAGLRAGDTILISSNTGINTVPVEAALYAKERGLTVVCVTSKKISRTLASRAPEGKRLYEVSDIVIDNHAPRGDGLLTIPGTQQITGGASTFGSLFIAQRIVLKIENLYLAQGRMPPVLCSANLPGGDEYNTSAVAAYQGRIKALC
ncbi:sugar isomerase domain-containing protein [Subdoligranulum sp. AM16-9]|nr:sugar isomerase domain-containing protein [Subdoligranulum sp. AM16-9]